MGRASQGVRARAALYSEYTSLLFASRLPSSYNVAMRPEPCSPVAEGGILPGGTLLGHWNGKSSVCNSAPKTTPITQNNFREIKLTACREISYLRCLTHQLS